jgi:hypothetical protein
LDLVVNVLDDGWAGGVVAVQPVNIVELGHAAELDAEAERIRGAFDGAAEEGNPGLGGPQTGHGWPVELLGRGDEALAVAFGMIEWLLVGMLETELVVAEGGEKMDRVCCGVVGHDGDNE